MFASNLTRGAAEALGVMAAFVMGGLGLAALERGVRPGGVLYPSRAMAVAPENRCEDAGEASDPLRRLAALVRLDQRAQVVAGNAEIEVLPLGAEERGHADDLTISVE